LLDAVFVTFLLLFKYQLAMMASTDLDNLLIMGFSQVKAEYALKKCGNGTASPQGNSYTIRH